MSESVRFTLITFIFLAVACGQRYTGSEVVIQLPWPSENGTYKLQFVPVGFTDLNGMEGPAVEFYDGPRAYQIPNSKNYAVTGSAPKGSFSYVKDQGYVPKTFKTMTVSTIYAHMERLDALLERVGYGDLLPRPRKVGIGPKINFAQDMTNNAGYVEAFDGILVFPFDLPGLPTFINAGVLAHEYFHAIYYHIYKKMVPFYHDEENKGDSDKSLKEFSEHARDRDKNLDQTGTVPNGTTNNSTSCGVVDYEPLAAKWSDTTLRALNEGLADVWAWIYTSDPKFVLHTFGKSEARRELKGDFNKLLDPTGFNNAYKFYLESFKCNKEMALARVTGLYYYYGTDLARFLVKVAETEQLTRQQLGNLILKTLEQMPKPGPGDQKKFMVTFEHFISTLLDNLKYKNSDTCELFKRIRPAGAMSCQK